MTYELLKGIADSAADNASLWVQLADNDEAENEAKCWRAATAALQTYAAAYAAMAARCDHERADALADLAADQRHERRMKGAGR